MIKELLAEVLEQTRDENGMIQTIDQLSSVYHYFKPDLRPKSRENLGELDKLPDKGRRQSRRLWRGV